MGDRPHFDLGGCTLTIVQGRPALPPDPAPRFPVVAFSIPELDGAIEILRHHGVDLPWGVEVNSTCRWVMFHDPAGNLVEIVEFKNQGRPIWSPLVARGYLRKSAKFSSTAWTSSLSSAK